MKKILQSICMLSLFAILFSSCKKDTATQAITNAASSLQNTLTAKIDNITYTPATITGTSAGTTKQIIAVSTNVQLSLTLLTTKTGTYNFLSLTPSFSLTYLELTAGAKPLTLTTGSLTISSYDESTGLITGTFSGTLFSTGQAQKTVSEGTFSVVAK